MSKFKTDRFFILVAALTLIEITHKLISGETLNTISCTLSLAASIILSLFLAWLIGKMKLQKLNVFTLIWLNLFIVRFFSNMIEGYFFTTIFNSLSIFINTTFIALGVTLIEAALAGALLTTEGEESLNTLLKKYFSSRSHGSWIKRILTGSIIYFPIYFFLGMLIFPFIAEYYSDPSLGLKVPGFEVIIPLEIFRGFLYVIISLPIMASIKENGKTQFIALSSMLFIPGALLPLILESSLPIQIVPFHLIEILADSLVYGFALSRILSKPKLNYRSSLT